MTIIGLEDRLQWPFNRRYKNKKSLLAFCSANSDVF